jgi:5-formyltetrahydrofolate cyclo-ligase
LPGLAYDRKCNRAGYGKGFYDRFLEEHKNLVKIGIAYDFQVFDELETDIWDIPLDYVITETTIYKG